MWAGLLSNETLVVRSAEVVFMAEGNTARTDRVRSGRAPRCRRTQARMYARRRDLGDLPVTTVLSIVVAKVKAEAKRRTHGGEESDSGIVPVKRRTKRGQPRGGAGGGKARAQRETRRKRPRSEHRVGKPQVGLYAGPDRSGTAARERCRQNWSEEPDALTRMSGSARGASGNRRPTATRVFRTGKPLVGPVLAIDDDVRPGPPVRGADAWRSRSPKSSNGLGAECRCVHA